MIPPASRISVRAVRRGGHAGGQVDEAGRRDELGRDADAHPVDRRDLLGLAHEQDAERQQQHGQHEADPAERAGDDGVDDVAHRPRQAPPLARGDDDRQPDEREAEAVAAVRRVELARAVPDAAGGAADEVRDAHPEAADGPDRQRAGRVPGGVGHRAAARRRARAAAAGGLGPAARGRARATRAGARRARRPAPRGTTARGGRTGRHGREATTKEPPASRPPRPPPEPIRADAPDPSRHRSRPKG